MPETILQRRNLYLSGASTVLGLLVALSTLAWGPWNDEFWTLASTARGLTLHEFLGNMYRDQHPILYYGLIYLAQASGITDLVALRSFNILGFILVAVTLAYAHRQKTINGGQILFVAVIYASSPLFLAYFAELRAYFILYSASISISILWLTIAQRVDETRVVSRGLIAAWTACLAVFVNLHYFATIFGGLLTLALLADLAWRKRWRLAAAIAAVSLAAAAPAVFLGAIQARFSLSGQMSWITTTFPQAIAIVAIIVAKAAALNVPAIGCAIIAALTPTEDRALRQQRRNIVVLIALTALFFGLMIGLNAVTPLIWDRYLMSAAGAVTVAIALLAGSAVAPKWGPAATAIVAVAWQIYGITWLDYDHRGFSPIAAAIVQTTAECKTTKVYAFIPAEGAAERRMGFRYYAEKFGFSYAEIASKAPQPITGGACPSLLWIWGTRFDAGKSAAQIVRDYDLRVEGNAVLELFEPQHYQILLAIR
ncbi:MAG TPA: hypothetical protein VMI47_13555 [Pseudolabrys sp.]|nr:hypothetical protein [Pseudolabrys sp.]